MRGRESVRGVALESPTVSKKARVEKREDRGEGRSVRRGILKVF